MEKQKESLVVVTGCGFKEVERVFHNNQYALIMQKDGKDYKINVGGATSLLLAKRGMDVLMVARTEEKLKILKEYITKKAGKSIQYYPCNLIDKSQVKKLNDYVKSKYKGKNISFVQSVGLGSQAYKLKDNNPYVLFDETNPQNIIKEYNVIVNSLLITIKTFLPILKKQDESHIVVVNSISGIRPYFRGYSHSAAKGGLYNAVRSLTLELFYRYENIFVSQVMPGIVDTGAYDAESVLKAISEIGETFGLQGKKKWNVDNFPLTSPVSIAETICLCLTSTSHILEIDVVAKGQIPHKGA